MSDRQMVLSYRAIRMWIGILGMILPLTVVLGGFIQSWVIQASISDYYYTNMRDYFSGLLSAVAIFLICYKGYDMLDDVITNLSGIASFGIVLFPTSWAGKEVIKVGTFQLPDTVSEYFHLSFACSFFLLLAYNSFFLFTKSGGLHTAKKITRNTIYRAAGVVMALCVLLMAVYVIFFRDTIIASIHPILILESVALMAFGLSWLIKGETFCRDSSH